MWNTLVIEIYCFFLCLSADVPSVLWCCWLAGRKGILPVKNWVVGAGMVICLERGADLHIAQLMPLPLTVSCSSKSKSAFLVPAYMGCLGKKACNQVSLCQLASPVYNWRILLWQNVTACTVHALADGSCSFEIMENTLSNITSLSLFTWIMATRLVYVHKQVIISAKWTERNWRKSCFHFCVCPSVRTQSHWFECAEWSIVFDSCVKSWEYFYTNNISLETLLHWLSEDIVRFKIEWGWGEMYKNVNTISDGFSAHAIARRHYRWRHYCWQASTAHVHHVGFWVGLQQITRSLFTVISVP